MSIIQQGYIFRSSFNVIGLGTFFMQNYKVLKYYYIDCLYPFFFEGRLFYCALLSKKKDFWISASLPFKLCNIVNPANWYVHILVPLHFAPFLHCLWQNCKFVPNVFPAMFCVICGATIFKPNCGVAAAGFWRERGVLKWLPSPILKSDTVLMLFHR